MPRKKRPVPDDFLPLRPLVFEILLLLKKERLHGYAIMKQVNEHASRRAILGPGTLYRTLKEMRDSGLVDYANAPADADERRSYYELTALGHSVVSAEALRVGRLLREARLSPTES